MSGMQLDLTQVKSEEKLLHELELELSDVSGLLDEKSKLAAGVKNDYIWQISKLVSNIKGISSKTASIQQHLQQEQQQRSTTNSQKRQRTDD